MPSVNTLVSQYLLGPNVLKTFRFEALQNYDGDALLEHVFPHPLHLLLALLHVVLRVIGVVRLVQLFFEQDPHLRTILIVTTQILSISPLYWDVAYYIDRALSLLQEEGQ